MGGKHGHHFVRCRPVGPVVAQHRERSTWPVAPRRPRGRSPRCSTNWTSNRFASSTVASTSTPCALLEAPLTTVRETIDDLQALLDDADDQWLVSPIRDRLHRLDADIDDYRGQADGVLAAVRRAGRARRGRPARVLHRLHHARRGRGSIGFMGNWAELTVDNGRSSTDPFRPNHRAERCRRTRSPAHRPG